MDAPLPPGLKFDDPLGKAANKILDFQFAQLAENEALIRAARNPLAVHQFRVAVRRMRAVLKAFKAYLPTLGRQALAADLKAIGAVTNPPRDIEVLTYKAAIYLAGQPAGGAVPFAPILDMYAAQRDQARLELLHYLEGQPHQAFLRRYQTFVAQLDSFDGPLAGEIVPGLVMGQWQKISAEFPEPSVMSVPQLHQLRIRLKVFRYTVEFFEELLPLEAVLVIDRMKGLQDLLGDMNDAYVASFKCAQVIGDWDSLAQHYSLKDDNRVALRGYCEAREAEQAELVAAFPAVWVGFCGLEFQELLGKALALTAVS
jgi:CHAD domain-containing protein